MVSVLANIFNCKLCKLFHKLVCWSYVVTSMIERVIIPRRDVRCQTWLADHLILSHTACPYPKHTFLVSFTWTKLIWSVMNLANERTRKQILEIKKPTCQEISGRALLSEYHKRWNKTTNLNTPRWPSFRHPFNDSGATNDGELLQNRFKNLMLGMNM